MSSLWCPEHFFPSSTQSCIFVWRKKKSHQTNPFASLSLLHTTLGCLSIHSWLLHTLNYGREGTVGHRFTSRQTSKRVVGVNVLAKQKGHPVVVVITILPHWTCLGFILTIMNEKSHNASSASASSTGTGVFTLSFICVSLPQFSQVVLFACIFFSWCYPTFPQG